MNVFGIIVTVLTPVVEMLAKKIIKKIGTRKVSIIIPSKDDILKYGSYKHYRY